MFDKPSIKCLSFLFMEGSDRVPEWLNYHHLRYFHAVAQEGSVRGASDKLRTSQPSICAQVKQLEVALGEKLYRRSGRSIALTDFGRLIYGYAEEIFALGRELLTTAKRAPSSRALSLQIGVVDSFPKLLSLEFLRPAFSHSPRIQVTCREGKLEDLMGQLGAHRLDALFADEPPPAGSQVKTFTHPIGSSGVTFCAAPALAKKLVGRFPKNLDGAPMLLPTQNTALRRDLEKWFRAVGISPVVVGEFEDAALSKIVATDGIGVTAVPTLVLAEAVERYGFVPVGQTKECEIHLYIITAERRIEHPAVAMLASEAKRTSQSPGRNPSVPAQKPAVPSQSKTRRPRKASPKRL
jgi:LysR family transcriptional regulator, transcriptional activator of nhaA